MWCWRVAVSYLFLLLSFLFCIPVFVKNFHGSLTESNRRILLQLAVLLCDIILGLVTLIFSLIRIECGIFFCLLIGIVGFIPNLAEIGFAAVPVFSDFCCCFPHRCLVTYTDLVDITQCNTACTAWDFVADEYTLFYIGSCLVFVSFVFVMSTTCFWWGTIAKKRAEFDFFVKKSQDYRTEAFAPTVMPHYE